MQAHVHHPSLDAPVLEPSPVREMPTWMEDLPEPAGLPEVIPDWVLMERSVLPEEPGCPCCGAAAPEPVRWAIPGLWESPAALPGPQASLRDLHAAIDRVCAEERLAYNDKQALADTAALLDATRKLRVHQMKQLADVHDRELHLLAGARSTAVWVRQLQPDADASDVRFGSSSRHFRSLRAAIDARAVSIAAGKKVLRALDKCSRWVDQADGLIDGQPAEPVVEAVVRNVVALVSAERMGLADDDPVLTSLIQATDEIVTGGGSELSRVERAFTLLATHVSMAVLPAMLEELFLAIVPSQLERDSAASDGFGNLKLKQRADGRGSDVSGILSHECTELFLTAARAELRRDQANPADRLAAEALRSQGLDPYFQEGWGNARPDADFGLPRDKASRLHDALKGLLKRYLDDGLGGIHQKVPVQINVTVSDTCLTGQPGALPAKGGSGRPIARALLRRWFCDSRVTAFVLSQGGIALRAVHLGRTLTAIERKAALIEHGHRCAGVGCCRGSTREGPAPDLRPHHVLGFAESGITTLDETIMVCDTLHFDIHEGKRTLRLRNGRLLNESGWVTEAALDPTDPPF